MIKQLSQEEQDSLHLRYRNNELFRHWSPLLCRMEWEMQELDPITLWYEAEKVILKLRNEKENREEMIQFVFRGLLKEFKSIKDDFGNDRIRTDAQAECSAVTVMAIVLTLLMNAVEKGHEEENFDNQPMCVAITAWLRSHPHFQFLMNDFFSRKMGFDGKRVVFTPSDPMNIEAQLASMAEELRKDIEDTIRMVLEYTSKLQQSFGDYWTIWKNLWQEVCMDQEFLKILKEVNPNKNEWGINQKMICNIIGIFCNALELDLTITEINRHLTTKQIGSYLRNHTAYGETDCALTKQQHEKIERSIGVILSALTQTSDNQRIKK